MLDTKNKQTEKHEHTHAQNRFAVIPTAEKLNADKQFSGKNVTVAFLDSGFYPHPDFAERVVEFHDVSGSEKSFNSITEPQNHHWHGTQTVVSCAGNGSLSDGIYKGLASEANLVLVKVSETGKISDESIEKGLQWISANREKYNIRVLNMSLGGDMDAKLDESKINQLAEELIKQGVVITVAAGNSSDSHSIPPANSPSVITVGGFSDENLFESENFDLYHSNFGKTADGFIKPEIIAPAMFVAAPILPETKDYKVAEILSMLHTAPDYAFRRLLEEYWRTADLPEDVLYCDISTAMKLVENEIKKRKIIAAHYQHVDGTSFAAPIAASVVAQMLEANPNLTPKIVKNILISTASRLSGFPAIRQGFGIINAKSAVEEAMREKHFSEDDFLMPPIIDGNRILFFHHDDKAKTIVLAGDFNDWDEKKSHFVKCKNDFWQAEIPCLPHGKYRYKFVIDGEKWTEDLNNGIKEEDGFGAFNSILIIE